MAGLERKIRKNRDRLSYYLKKGVCPRCKSDTLKPFVGGDGFVCTNCESQYTRRK